MRPRSSPLLVRAALLHLAAGTLLGVWVLAARVGWLPAPPDAWRDVHVEILLFGWLLQLATGVAFWILPRSPGARATRPDPPARQVLWLLNGGVLCGLAARALPEPGPWLVVARTLVLLAGLGFARQVARRLASLPSA